MKKKWRSKSDYFKSDLPMLSMSILEEYVHGITQSKFSKNKMHGGIVQIKENMEHLKEMYRIRDTLIFLSNGWQERSYQLINLWLLNGCGCNTGQTVRLRENFKFAKLIPPFIFCKLAFLLTNVRFSLKTFTKILRIE